MNVQMPRSLRASWGPDTTLEGVSCTRGSGHVLEAAP